MSAAERLAQDAGYRGVGTVEFLYDPEARRCYFAGVSAWLEHAVTEAVTGLDLVKLQLHLAAGGRLEADPPLPVGHAIEARLRAEDPALGFAPTPGRLAHLRLPTGLGLRVDTGVIEGDGIPAEFDPMICKLTAWGSDRSEALARLHRALGDTVAVLDGGTTNQGFLLELLDHPKLCAGEVDSGWLDRLSVTGGTLPARHGDLALLQAAIELSDQDAADDRARFYAFARRGRPQAAGALSRTYELRHRGQPYRLAVSQIAPDRYRVTVDRLSTRARGPPARPARAPRRATRADPPDADLESGRRPANRGRRRAASHLPRRRRGRPGSESRARGLDPGVPWGDRRGGRRGRGRGGDEDGVVADRAVPRTSQAGAGWRERPRRRAGTTRRAGADRATRADDARRAPVVRVADACLRPPRPIPAGRTCDGWSGSCSATTSTPQRCDGPSTTFMANALICCRATRR